MIFTIIFIQQTFNRLLINNMTPLALSEVINFLDSLLQIRYTLYQ